MIEDIVARVRRKMVVVMEGFGVWGYEKVFCCVGFVGCEGFEVVDAVYID